MEGTTSLLRVLSSAQRCGTLAPERFTLPGKTVGVVSSSSLSSCPAACIEQGGRSEGGEQA